MGRSHRVRCYCGFIGSRSSQNRSFVSASMECGNQSRSCDGDVLFHRFRDDHVDRNCLFPCVRDGAVQCDRLFSTLGAVDVPRPGVFHGIGVFTATFLYAICAMAWVDRLGSGNVPFFSGWLVVGLLLASVGMFIGLVNSLSHLQITSVLAFTGDFARQIIDVMYPPLGKSDVVAGADELALLAVTQKMLHSGPPRAIQSLDVARLAGLAEQVNGVIEMLSGVGDTVVTSTPLLRVYGGSQAIDERDLKKAIRTGTQRTFEQDPKYSIQLLRDIAIRALSPAVNDPTTAVQALDQMEDLLLRLGRRCLEIGEVRDDSGRLRLVIPVPSWDDFLDLALSEIRYYGRESMQVVRRMKALLSDLSDALPNARVPALRSQQKRLRRYNHPVVSGHRRPIGGVYGG